MSTFEAINCNWTNNGKHEGGVSTGIGYTISWQRGPVNENGRNGAFLIEVLDSCLHQLYYFQESNPEFSCEENDRALENLKACLKALNARRARRLAEGTLGTHKP
ncbi:hypothetical protein ACQ4M3_09620 [Leptolyngbya sp. AN03gr2]|uniref:hypothetical protein n=1 Tax=Leptolyngbya sp. AN03gr2 TaxID=3423364 RepID=UPI003D31CBBF